mmetsp:Transcript_8516/g.22001  ORF Transcript_8516/g.22001 Transcript_8516/m.22001 type:complete len:327 (+) Transcript_8516:952-1932(+)
MSSPLFSATTIFRLFISTRASCTCSSPISAISTSRRCGRSSTKWTAIRHSAAPTLGCAPCPSASATTRSAPCRAMCCRRSRMPNRPRCRCRRSSSRFPRPSNASCRRSNDSSLSSSSSFSAHISSASSSSSRRVALGPSRRWLRAHSHSRQRVLSCSSHLCTTPSSTRRVRRLGTRRPQPRSWAILVFRALTQAVWTRTWHWPCSCRPSSTRRMRGRHKRGVPRRTPRRRRRRSRTSHPWHSRGRCKARRPWVRSRTRPTRFRCSSRAQRWVNRWRSRGAHHRVAVGRSSANRLAAAATVATRSAPSCNTTAGLRLSASQGPTVTR